MQDVAAQADVEYADAMLSGFVVRFLIVPAIVCNPVAGDDGASAVAPALAMDEDRPTFARVQ